VILNSNTYAASVPAVRKALALVTAVLALALTAQPASAHSARPPNGYHSVTVKKAGMTIAVPDGWVKVDLTRRPIDAFIRQFKKSDPKGAALVASRHDFLAANGLFAAFDPGLRAYSAFVTVAATATGSPFIPTGRPDAVQAAYAQNLAINDSQVADASLAGAPAAAITSTTQAPTGKGRSTTVHNTGYVVATKDGALQIDFAGRKDASHDKTVQTMVASVSFDQVTVPFEVTGSGTLGGTGELRGTATGSGIASFAGTSQLFGGQPPSCGAGSGVPFRASNNLAATNGDVVNTDVSGTVCQSGSHRSGNLILFEGDTTETYTITGGTGCFTGATGNGQATTHVSANDPNNASIDISDNGTITLKKRPNCPYFQG
jgi:hypothetical protein